MAARAPPARVRDLRARSPATDLPGLCDRSARCCGERSEVAFCDVSGVPVDAVDRRCARAAAARRAPHGCRVRLRQASTELSSSSRSWGSGRRRRLGGRPRDARPTRPARRRRRSPRTSSAVRRGPRAAYCRAPSGYAGRTAPGPSRTPSRRGARAPRSRPSRRLRRRQTILKQSGSCSYRALPLGDLRPPVLRARRGTRIIAGSPSSPS